MWSDSETARFWLVNMSQVSISCHCFDFFQAVMTFGGDGGDPRMQVLAFSKADTECSVDRCSITPVQDIIWYENFNLVLDCMSASLSILHCLIVEIYVFSPHCDVNYLSYSKI